MFPKGFFAKGVAAGIKKVKGKKDLALFYSETPCTTVGMFTSNIVKAAPVLLSLKHLKARPDNIRAVIANAGCANACTGKKGIDDAGFCAETLAGMLGIQKQNVLVASTGVIGQFLPVYKILAGLEKLHFDVLKGKSDEVSAADAIMTTDTIRKVSTAAFVVDGKKINVWGCTKGAGMIHPSLVPSNKLHATMLAFILTDAGIERGALDSALKEGVEDSFNCVSVDGDTSTNDTVVVLANGLAGNKKIVNGSAGYRKFCEVLSEVCLDLAKMMARDGEGATKLVEVVVRNAKSKSDAKKIASTIATSPLFKTAIFGNDANWGRVLAAAGRAGVNFNPEKTSVFIGNILVEKNGMAVDFSEAIAKKALTKKEVKVTLDLNAGKQESRYYTCDLTFDYIKINASYRS
jgi:glutamate N-acetyltransferase/amino-acid N-acetyltransferase